jgi:signal transduction histidine kinase
MEESKMRLNLKRMILALAAVALLGTGSVFASPPVPSPDSSAYLSGRASTLLAEIQEEAVGLGLNGETLGTFAWNPQTSWQSHAFYLDRVKSHINAVGERAGELQRISYAVLPWQQQAISEVTSHAAQVAASTSAAIVHLRENQNRLFVPEYRDHLTTIAHRSEDLKQTVNKFLDYEKTQQKLHQLQNELELAGD